MCDTLRKCHVIQQKPDITKIGNETVATHALSSEFGHELPNPH